MPFSETDKNALLELARQSLAYSTNHGGRILKIDLAKFPAQLREQRATFVTLEKHGRLRGCVGMIVAVNPLAEDVVHSAHAAAFKDHRFPPLQKEELPELEIHISVLTPLERIEFSSEADLIDKIRPHVDGLVLTEDGMRGTFLPVMWEELQTPRQFLNHLKLKAGLPMHYWSESIEVERFTAERIP